MIANKNIPIIAEGEDWIVVDKPPFMEAHPSKPGGRTTLWDELRELLAFELANGGQVSIITRLDRETSGLTLVAKTRGAARTFCRHMEARRIHKEYLAIVLGTPAQAKWEIDAPILRQGSRGPSRIYLKQGVHPEGAVAQTRFEVLENSGDFTLVRCIPVTGRMHQIRVHLAHSGHPIVGDKIYGTDEGCYLEFIKTGWTPALASRLLLSRHALHAAGLQIEGRNEGWASPLPQDLAEFSSRHGLSAAYKAKS